MKVKNWAEPVETVQPTGKLLGGLRVARVEYEHIPLHESNGGMTLGQVVDQHIAATVDNGSLVSEVCLFFETREQQEILAGLYRKI